MNLPKEVSPAQAAALVRGGARMIDIREAAERKSAGVIPGAAHAPLSALRAARIEAAPGQALIFHCKAGGRTKQNAEALAGKAGACEIYLLQGGIDAWRDAGLPVEAAR